jgi:thiol:disulfide interchange protein DsbA
MAQFNVVAGRDYAPINPPQPTSGDATVEVLEFFAYGCIHCFHLEPKLDKWSASVPKDTKLVRVPMPGSLKGVNSAQMYYTLQAMGMIDKLHMKIFEAAHNENLPLVNPDVRNQWLARNGVDPKKFDEVEKSFTVQNRIKRVTDLAQSHRVETTPTMVVNGKFAVPNQTNSDLTFRILDSLAAMERAASKAAAPAATPAKAEPSPPKVVPAKTPAAPKPAK